MTLNLSKVGSATSSTASEIPAFDPISDRLFVVAQSKVDVYTVSNTGALTAAGQLVLGFALPIGTVAVPNSVAVKNGVVAWLMRLKIVQPMLISKVELFFTMQLMVQF